MTALLYIAQDNLLTDLPGVHVDYLGTGLTFTPGAAASPNPSLAKLLVYVPRWITGRYNWLIVPALNFSWHGDPTSLRRKVRRLLSVVKWRPFGGKTLFQRFNPRQTQVCVLDRFDTTQVFDDFADAVGSRVYFKTNIRQDDCARYRERSWQLEFLPLWIATDRYPQPATTKEYDLFYAAAPVSAARRNAHAEVQKLREAGVRVQAVEVREIGVGVRERLPFEEFVNRMSRSWLTLSPEGYGYHCFRHSEAMLMESVPVINRPTTALITDLRDQENCLLYDSESPGDLCRVVQSALADKPRLARWSKELRRYALENYSPQAVGNRIFSRLCGQAQTARSNH